LLPLNCPLSILKSFDCCRFFSMISPQLTIIGTLSPVKLPPDTIPPPANACKPEKADCTCAVAAPIIPGNAKNPPGIKAAAFAADVMALAIASCFLACILTPFISFWVMKPDKACDATLARLCNMLETKAFKISFDMPKDSDNLLAITENELLMALLITCAKFLACVSLAIKLSKASSVMIFSQLN